MDASYETRLALFALSNSKQESEGAEMNANITADELFAKIGRLQLQVERRDEVIAVLQARIAELEANQCSCPPEEVTEES